MQVDTYSSNNLMNVSIDRTKWLRGKEAVEQGAYLYHPKLLKTDVICSLLFDYFGDTRTVIGKRFVSQVVDNYAGRNKVIDRPLEWLVTPSHTDTPEAYALMQINDDPALGEAEREASIAAFLIKYKIGIKFTDGVEKPKAPASKSKTTDIYNSISQSARAPRATRTADGWTINLEGNIAPPRPRRTTNDDV
jgi:hypothetical protein